MSKTKELVKDEKNLPVEADMFDDFDNTDNMGELELPKIKMVSSAQMFELPDSKKVESLEGHIIDQQRYIILWGGKDDPRPAAVSEDGNKWTKMDEDLCMQYGIKDIKVGESVIESKCMQWGSDPNGGKGKWASERIKLFFLRDGHELPSMMDISSMSLKPYKQYMVGLKDAGIKAPIARTKISLDKVEKGSDVFSRWAFENMGSAEGDALKNVHAVYVATREHKAKYMQQDMSNESESVPF